MKDKGRSGKIIGMNRCYFAALALLLTGCARHQAPAVAALPTATPIPAATPRTVPIPVMPVQITPTPDPIVSRELMRLRTASPERDLEAAWANKDTRFLGVNGYTLNLPGVPKERIRAAVMSGKINPIEGTTDGASLPEQWELNRIATKYATRYNQLLLQKLDEQRNAKSN